MELAGVPLEPLQNDAGTRASAWKQARCAAGGRRRCRGAPARLGRNLANASPGRTHAGAKSLSASSASASVFRRTFATGLVARVPDDAGSTPATLLGTAGVGGATSRDRPVSQRTDDARGRRGAPPPSPTPHDRRRDAQEDVRGRVRPLVLPGDVPGIRCRGTGAAASLRLPSPPAPRRLASAHAASPHSAHARDRN